LLIVILIHVFVTILIFNLAVKGKI